VGAFDTDLADGVLVGGLSLSALPEMEIWMKLLEQSALGEWMIGLPGELVAEAQALVAPKRLRRLIEIDQSVWKQIVQPDQPSRSFCLVAGGGVVLRLVIGPPTEEVWESFEELATLLG
jgi:hypothetical protein